MLERHIERVTHRWDVLGQQVCLMLLIVPSHEDRPRRWRQDFYQQCLQVCQTNDHRQ
jgi:hypothetical protein